MTKAEAIEWLEYHIATTDYDKDDDLLKALKYAVRKLKAEPTKHGRWIDSWGGKWHSCSVCGGIPPFNMMGDDMPTPYCPHCGARMIDEVEDE